SHRPQVGPVLLKLLCQPLIFTHRSHPLAFMCQRDDPNDEGFVTTRRFTMNAMERNAAMKPVLVTGGTGTLGKHVITRLQNTGLPFRVLTRSPKAGCGTFTYVTGDLETGEGVDAAVQGVETILHLAGSAKGDEVKARTLVTAARKAGNPHLIFISV